GGRQHERLHSAQRSIGEGAAKALSCVARLVAMLLVEQRVEGSVERLDLRFARTPEEAMPLSEVDGVMQHVQLGKGCLRGLCAPVLMNITHHTAPCVEIGRCPDISTK